MKSVVTSGDAIFVHLSDIHFRKGQVGDVHDQNAPLRHEVDLDLRRLRPGLSRLDGILVTGDVAFGGKKAEFDFAENWLKSLSEQLGCGESGILVVPGNHDVDRSVIEADEQIALIQEEIRNSAPAGRALTLATKLRDEGIAERLLRPIDEYNRFAEKYDCKCHRDAPYWIRDFSLSDGSVLRLRGINTTFLSGPRDNQETHKMLYGAAQISILREDRVHVAILGHHPPSWAFDGEDADHTFSLLTVLQLYGHKHSQWLTQIGKSVRLIAGAVHPDASEPHWQPRYSVIAISAIRNGLKIRVLPRVWSEEEHTFQAAFNSLGQPYRNYVLKF